MNDNLKLAERLANARLLRTGALQEYINDPSGPIRPLDEKGRTPQDRYHYWCAVVDTYAFLVDLAAKEEAAKLAAEVGVVCQVCGEVDCAGGPHEDLPFTGEQ